MNPTDIDRILADFRVWLEQAPPEIQTPSSPPAEPVDLAALVRQFIALRQEVNLQTKSSRGQLEQTAQAMEQNVKTLDAFQRAMDKLDGQAKSDDDRLAEAKRPLLKALIDARDALVLARKHVDKLQAFPPPAETTIRLDAEQPPELELALPFWAELFGLGSRVRHAAAPLREWARARAGAATVNVPDSTRELAESLSVGYAMSLQRLDRAIEQQGLESIDCVGYPFDPEIMEVAEVVKEEGRQSTEVLEVVRAGYIWRDKLFRAAHVRVARPAT